ncbi:7802_t:CDS:2, partial [Racocetra persica]
GMQSIQCVKSINVLIHKAVSASSSIANVVEALDSRIQQEPINKSFMAWNTTIHTQIYESVLYKYEKVPNEEAFKFIKDQLNEVLLADNQDNEDITNIEDHYDHRQAYLKTLMNSVLKELICEMWRIVPYMTTTFVGVSSKGFKRFQSDNLQEIYPIPKHYNNMQESQIYQYTHKKLYYS